MPSKFFPSLIWLLLAASATCAQTTAFTYQGELTDAGNPANGNYDLQFKLFDTVTVGTGAQQGAPVTVSNVTVTAGVFTVQLDFGAGVFPGAPRFLEIAVKPSSGGTFTVLGPRQPITSTPYAIRSANAAVADNLSPACAGCVTGAQIGSLPANNGNYIQNTSAPQSASNFNISGNGTAGGTLSAATVNATTQYNLGGNRSLSNPGTNNLFAGVGAGAANTLGADNAFFGYHAGLNNTGNLTVGGRFNSFFGSSAGRLITQGRFNSFFGANSGSASTAGNNNSFFGANAGSSNTGDDNAFFGVATGEANTGTGNSFFGVNAGSNNLNGSNNTIIGANANVDLGSRNNATAIGTGAVVNASNRIQLGRRDLDTVAIGTPLLAGASAQLCIDPVGVFSHCSSSLRYKENVQLLGQGLHLIQRLRPVNFTWKESHTPDLGLIAEEVAAVEPLLATHNNKGEIEGVKYDQLTVVLINAVKEQQAQIETLRAANAALHARLRAVEKVVRKKAGAVRRR